MNLADFVKNRKPKKGSIRGLQFLSGDSLLQQELKEQHDRLEKEEIEKNGDARPSSPKSQPDGVFFESSTTTFDNDDDQDEERDNLRLTASQRTARRHARNRRSQMALINGSIIFHQKREQGHYAIAKAKAIRLHQAHDHSSLAIDDETGEANGDAKGNEYGVLSSLPPTTVKWMNARKKTSGPLAPFYKYHSTLASALPFKPVFKGDLPLSLPHPTRFTAA